MRVPSMRVQCQDQPRSPGKPKEKGYCPSRASRDTNNGKSHRHQGAPCAGSRALSLMYTLASLTLLAHHIKKLNPFLASYSWCVVPVSGFLVAIPGC